MVGAFGARGQVKFEGQTRSHRQETHGGKDANDVLPVRSHGRLYILLKAGNTLFNTPL